MIACVRIPAFAANIEERDNPQLAGTPFVLVDTGGVCGVSSSALSSGVRIGMTLRQAQTLCPAAQVVASNPARTRRAADELMEALATFTDLVEMEVAPHRPVRSRRPQLAIGEAEGDGTWFINPGRLLREQGIALARTIHQTMHEKTRLDAAIGLAANRFTARVAAGSINPGETLLVPRSSEGEFLAAYPVTLLPIYPEQTRQLRLLGIRTLGDLAKLPASAMGDLFGKQGAAFKRLAAGRDTTPVRLFTPRRAEHCARQLEDPVGDRQILYNVIEMLVVDLSRKLEARGQMAGELALAVMPAGGGSHYGEMALRQPSASAAHLAQTVVEMLDRLQLVEPVKEVEVTLGGIVEAEARQLSFFPPESVPQDKLRQTLQQLIARYGPEMCYWASLADPDELVPEHRYRLRQAEAA